MRSKVDFQSCIQDTFVVDNRDMNYFLYPHEVGHVVPILFSRVRHLRSTVVRFIE